MRALITCALLLASALYCLAEVPVVEDDPLFPAAEPLQTGHLQVSDLHQIFFATYGNPDGKPVMCLHGGPGGGSYPRLARYFNPEKYFIVLHDQRGNGRSTPHGELRENSTPELVRDIEALRRHLGLGKVLIFGGSWGSTLGLAYAEEYPENVSGMILRGVFLGTEEEIDFHYQTTGHFFPAEQQALIDVLPDPARGVDPDYLFKLITSDDTALRERVVRALGRFELKFMKLSMPDETVEEWLGGVTTEEGLRMSQIDLHYVTHRYFLADGQLLADIAKLKDMPAILISGRYDMASPPRSAYRLHRRMPRSKLVVVEQAGHSESEPGITRALVEAAAAFE